MLETAKGKQRTLVLFVILGVLLVLIPSLGFPARVNYRLGFIIGILLIVFSLLLRRSLFAKPHHDEGQQH